MKPRKGDRDGNGLRSREEAAMMEEGRPAVAAEEAAREETSIMKTV